MNKLSTDILQHIFNYIKSPIDLLLIAQVNKTFYKISRADNAWLKQKQRILNEFPVLSELFLIYKNKTKIKNGNQLLIAKKKSKCVKQWKTPKGIWYVFAKHLLFENISHILLRPKSRKYVIDAVCQSAIMPQTMVTIEARNHIKLKDCRFQRCIRLKNYTFIWIGIQKFKSKVFICDDQENIKIIESNILTHNFKFILQNIQVYKPIYIK